MMAIQIKAGWLGISAEVAKVNTLEQWDNLPAETKVDFIVYARDESRIENRGGYWSEYVIHWGHVIIASVDYKGGPDLTVQKIDEWIAQNEEIITEYLDELQSTDGENHDDCQSS